MCFLLFSCVGLLVGAMDEQLCLSCACESLRPASPPFVDQWLRDGARTGTSRSMPGGMAVLDQRHEQHPAHDVSDRREAEKAEEIREGRSLPREDSGEH